MKLDTKTWSLLLKVLALGLLAGALIDHATDRAAIVTPLPGLDLDLDLDLGHFGTGSAPGASSERSTVGSAFGHCLRLARALLAQLAPGRSTCILC